MCFTTQNCDSVPSSRLSLHLAEQESYLTFAFTPVRALRDRSATPFQVLISHLLVHWPGRKVSCRESLPAQPVDATPSDRNVFSKGGVYDATETGEAFREPTERDVVPLASGAVV